MNYTDLAQDMETKIKAIFGDSHVVKVRHTTNISESIGIVFYGVNPANGIRHNSHTHMQFMCHISEGKFELLGRSHHQRDIIKFRKTGGKTIEEAGNKMVKWFEKNYDAIMALHHLEKASK